jgi:uncharacterized cupredoxin-like copper-binding protein
MAYIAAMARTGEGSSSQSKISRAPVLVVVAGAGLAIGLVLLGAWLTSAPAPVPRIDQPGTAAVPRQVNVILRDYAFDPDPLYLVPGETVQFNVINGGMVEHEFVIGDAAVQGAWELADEAATPDALLATAPPASVAPGVGGLRLLLAPGQSATAIYEVPIGGPLSLICHLPGHAEKGMVAQVVLLNR